MIRTITKNKIGAFFDEKKIVTLYRNNFFSLFHPQKEKKTYNDRESSGCERQIFKMKDNMI